MEHLEPLGAGRYIWVDEDCGFGTDAVLLADFARPSCWGAARDHEVICELGTGCGILPLLWHRIPRAADAPPIHCVEVQPHAVQLARRSMEYNGLSGQVAVHEADWNRLQPLFPEGTFQRVVVNPPYFPPGSGKTSLSPAARLARHEQPGGLEALAAAAARLLGNGGRLCLCHRPERLADVMAALRSAGLEPKRLRLVQQRGDTTPWLLLLEARKQGRPGLAVEPALLMETEEGKPTAEYGRILGYQP